MNKTVYNFVGRRIMDDTKYDLEKNPYSSYACPSKSFADWWAKEILRWNSAFDFVLYKNVKGWKIYKMEREVDEIVIDDLWGENKDHTRSD